MPSLFRLAKHELRLAWRRFQFQRGYTATGLGDSAWMLHGIVRAMKPETCVEIGTAHGHSACVIALALEQNLRGRLWAVDPHDTNAWNDAGRSDTLTALRRNLRRVGVAHRVEIVRQRTADAVAELPDGIDFAFIDGDHTYEGVKQDWEILRPRMRPFSVVAFHDTLWDRRADDPRYRQWRRDGMGVPQLVEELRRAGYPVITIDRDWGVTLLQVPPGGEPLRLIPASA